MKINAQTPFKIDENGQASFFVGGEWQAPIDLPEFVKYREFLRYQEWEYDTDTGKLRVYQGDGNWSAEFDPPASIGTGGGGGGTSETVTPLSSGDLNLTSGMSVLGSDEYSRTTNIIHLRLGLLIGAGTVKNAGSILCTLPVGARPKATQFFAIAVDEMGTHLVKPIEVNQNGSVITQDNLNEFTSIYVHVSYTAP